MAGIELRPGYTIYFGNYPQDSSGETAPMAWRVLDVKEGRALLLSRDILDVQPYAGDDGSVFWGNCFLRGWLENEFRPRAFSPEENALVFQPEDPAYGDTDELLWEQFGMEDMTESVHDAVFVLSVDDILRYFPGENSLFCPGASARGTEWVEERTNGESLCWWLRSSSDRYGYVQVVSPADSIGACGMPRETLHGVRPAFWLRTDR